MSPHQSSATGSAGASLQLQLQLCWALTVCVNMSAMMGFALPPLPHTDKAL